jgi:hypothetical protein
LFKGSLFLFLDSCTASLPVKIACQTVCPNPTPKPFCQLRKTVNLWPGQIPGERQVHLSDILCSHVCSAGVNMCLHPFHQKKLPCQDFLCLSCVCFWHWGVINFNNWNLQRTRTEVIVIQAPLNHRNTLVTRTMRNFCPLP